MMIKNIGGNDGGHGYSALIVLIFIKNDTTNIKIYKSDYHWLRQDGKKKEILILVCLTKRASFFERLKAETMETKQFYDESLAHASYAVVSNGEMALVDPGRDPKPYLDFARQHNVKVVAVFETHPHADFISSHLEFYEKYGANIYINSEAGVSYPHKPMNDGDEVRIGQVTVRALFTPGHSPDHNTYLLFDEQGNPYAVYTGDALFVGDVGRPDLREGAGNVRMKRKELAHLMFRTIRDVFETLEDDVWVYPAHGAGSLCGKSMRAETYSTLGREKKQNWAFQVKAEEDFVEDLLKNQPFIPKYFPHDVEVNRTGAAPFEESVGAVPHLDKYRPLEAGIPVVDVRSPLLYKRGHLKGAINIPEGDQFETWLGTVIGPGETFYLLVEDNVQLDRIVRRIAKIGYENNIKGAVEYQEYFQERSQILDLEHFNLHPEEYSIIDMRNPLEVQDGKYFKRALHIPLFELRERVREVKTDRPIVVHCAGGYRSAIGSSLCERAMLDTKVYDLGEAIKNFQFLPHKTTQYEA